METPQVDEFVMWMGGMATALVAVSAGMIVLKKFLLGQLYSDIEDVRSQLHRNSGTSLRDAVDRIEERQQDIGRSVDRVTERFDAHINFHLEDK